MRFLGFEIRKALNPLPAAGNNMGWRVISEPFTGAWQRNIEETRGDLSAYPALYACIMRIAYDIGKMPFLLKRKEPDGTYTEFENPAYSPVLRKPNHYQTAQQFRESWTISVLQEGNMYALKQRDQRDVVTALYILDPSRVTPLISDTGAVYYELKPHNINRIPEASDRRIVVPASEIIHDRAVTLFHPLVGVPPLCAAYWPAVKNLRILRNSSQFFGNGARPGGLLTVPAGMDEDEAKALTKDWNENFTGANSGKVAVLGADLKYQAMGENSANSQLVEQMRYSDEQICQPFGVPPFKIGIGSLPAGMKVDEMNVTYMQDALQHRIYAMETLLAEGLSIARPNYVWMDEDELTRMDVGKQADVEQKLVTGKIKKPDEARVKFNLPPTPGGDTLWGQHQDYPLGVLASRTDVDQSPTQPSGGGGGGDDDEGVVNEARSIVATQKAIDAMLKAMQPESVDV